jgi:hypothetical protein
MLELPGPRWRHRRAASAATLPDPRPLARSCARAVRPASGDRNKVRPRPVDGERRRRINRERAEPHGEYAKIEESIRALIEQLDRFAAQHLSCDGLDFEGWLGWTVIDREQWLARIVFSKS